MTMKKFLTILILLPLLMSCKQEDTLLAERDKIEKYLTESLKLINENEVNGVDEYPAFYSIFGRYAYRYIVNYYDEGREDKPVVEWGDDVQIRFTAYIFTGSKPEDSGIYWSNIPEVIDELGDHGDTIAGNTLDWPKEPLTIRLGTTKILAGLEYTLPGCRENDEVQIYMTSGLAYGENQIGVVPKESMVAWYIKIEKITK